MKHMAIGIHNPFRKLNTQSQNHQCEDNVISALRLLCKHACGPVTNLIDWSNQELILSKYITWVVNTQFYHFYLFIYLPYIYICMYVCIYVCMHVCIYICVYVCIYVCIYVCMKKISREENPKGKKKDKWSLC